MLFADVIIDRSLKALDRTFQYKIPKEMENEAVIGALVKVPFGRGNSTIEGYIVDVGSEPGFAPEKTKEILEVMTQGVMVESQLISLAYWLRRNYGATLNDALKTVLPVKKTIKPVKKRSLRLLVDREELNRQIENAKKKKHVAKHRLLLAFAESMEEQPVLDYDNIVHRLNISGQTIQSMVKAGIMEVEEQRIFRNPSYLESNGKKNIQLNEEQEEIVKDFMQDYDGGIRRTYLLHGVTGSGKTEVYMEMIAHVLRAGRQAIMLIPEIALTYQMVQRFYERFGDVVSVIHSRLSAGEKYDQFLRAKQGELKVIIGPRSALFAPFPDLGLIIMDEEHEGGYKSEMPPKYHARETAIERARMAGASVVLGSATPSMEAYYRAQSGEYKLYTLTRRAGKGNLPDVDIVDLREEFSKKNYSIFSTSLQEKIEGCLERKEQVMLFLNRRGYASLVSCRKCGKEIGCPHCDVSLTSHRVQGKIAYLQCHYCGYQIPMPDKCPSCQSKYIGGFGTGTQKVEEQVKQIFPGARVLRMDADTTSGKDGHLKILSAFASHEADILVGTQMIVKGHDFPDVTLVGVLVGDLSLHNNDFRSAERTFQLLCQAAGRAGRGDKKGSVVIQTYQPEHYAIVSAAAQDYEQFYNSELEFRKMLQYPPVSHILAMSVYGQNEKLVIQMAEKTAALMKESGEDVIGPSKASVYKVNDIYRMYIYAKSREKNRLLDCKDKLEKCSRDWPESRHVRMQSDFL